MKKIPDTFITPAEAGKLLGMSALNIQIALRRGNFPFGFAVHNGKQWTYRIPRAPLMRFLENGRIEKSEVTA